MTITFEADGCTIFLPETESSLVNPELARSAIERDRNIRRSHLFPLFDATARFACSLLVVPQGCKPFELPRDPWIISIGDDMHFSWGPQAFPAESLEAAIKAAEHGVIITSGPDPFPYRVAATVAVKHRMNCLLIETLPHQKDAWRERIEAVRGADEFTGELPITYCMPFPAKGAA
ncbi:hypothetical protein [Bradyrhizobium sp. CCBAU 53421]|uniref:hypothetical protein n=1 Tax=Bradyrhizobium sp. CCBAU 53421 TaxID=1325120 RepID=UPI00188B4B54|nr:hypothetical protein [Bradyrhizobium sp. CCBAU 53421]QOZ34430.1 hypothetical protein XH92_24500 [Bradyrhizobium sp. CCBAU 53421]